MENIDFIIKNNKKYYRLSDFKKYLNELNMQYAIKKSQADYIIETTENNISYRYMDLENLNKVVQYYLDCNDYRHSVGKKLFHIIKELENCEDHQQKNSVFSPNLVQNEASDFLKSFISQKFGLLRIVILQDEFWFVGKDVAQALGYKDTDQALRMHVDEEDKLTRKFNGSGQNRDTIVINESGFYSLVLSSKLPTAKEFKRWVTAEVLPSIRKHDAYIEPQTLEQMISSPEFGIRLLTALKEEQEKNKKISEENERLNFINQGLVHQTMTWKHRSVLNALLRSLAHSSFNGNYQYAYNTFYKELLYKKGISLKQRPGKGNLVDKIREDEWNDVVEVAIALCEYKGINVESVVNEVNAERITKI